MTLQKKVLFFYSPDRTQAQKNREFGAKSVEMNQGAAQKHAGSYLQPCLHSVVQLSLPR